MNKKLKVEHNGVEKEYKIETNGKVEKIPLSIKIEIVENSFLHIGAAPSPLTEKKAGIFKVNRTPVIPASSFKGALRNQLELLFIDEAKSFYKQLKIPEDKIGLLKPCIPSPNPSYAEQELLNLKKYRGKMEGRKYLGNCEIKIDEKKIDIPKINNEEIGICPVCYFMGATGIMGCLRIDNFYPEKESGVLDQTNIRIDRKSNTTARGAKVDGEQVKPGVIFNGKIYIVFSDPIMGYQGIQFGDARKINGTIIDKWLESWDETDKNKKVAFLIENILIPAIHNIKELGGQKSKGAGKVNISTSY